MTLQPPYDLIPAVETDAYIALGSNQGDRELNLLRAVAELGMIPGCRMTALSPFYETTPTGAAVGQDSFYNAVARVVCSLTADELFRQLERIECDLFRRVRSGSCDPRRMDLDLLLFGEETISTPHLTVPHPRFAGRRFVLQPLCDIAPDLRPPPGDRTVRELLAGLTDDERVVPV